ncbi:MAG: adenylate kinase [Chlorobia bacterium]|nr:adenylate kinase [Fimbriimonadaceae bacterium]
MHVNLAKLEGVSRIVVYGVAGSGKTTMARRLADMTGLPFHAVDDLTWEPDWKIVPFDDQRVIFRDLCSSDAWILDNAYGHWIEIPLERVQLIVALDFPRWVSFGRLLKRTLRRLVDQETVCNGNRESLRLMLSRDSILLWHFRSFRRKRERIRKWVEEGVPVVHLKNPLEARVWLNGLSDSK